MLLPEDIAPGGGIDEPDLSDYRKLVFFNTACSILRSSCGCGVRGELLIKDKNASAAQRLGIAVPLFSLVMVLCIAILIIGIPFPGFAAVLAVAPRAVLFVVERCLGFLSALPYASLDLPTIPLASCALFLAMLFVLSPYVLRPFQKRAGLAVFCLLLFTCSLVFSIITL